MSNMPKADVWMERSREKTFIFMVTQKVLQLNLADIPLSLCMFSVDFYNNIHGANTAGCTFIWSCFRLQLSATLSSLKSSIKCHFKGKKVNMQCVKYHEPIYKYPRMMSVLLVGHIFGC